jgi:2-polyprenyl-3-methyl-5-hydroxy-6-metoxy-1,4-benzoquinol methylase
MNSDRTSQPALFPETADIETSSDNYAVRFAGPTGEWMLRVQETIVLDLLKKRDAVSILDVGGGHGQLAFPMCREKYQVTVLGSSESCRARIASLADGGQCRFVVGNVIDLPFGDRSFDSVVSFRMITHCGHWPRLIGEFCRVARRSVVVDYPTVQSLNMIAPALFRAKKRLEGDTRAWRLFRHDEIRDEFARHGFAPGARTGQFFLPMVLHRALKCRDLSAGLEGVCRAAGLSKSWGSPVIIEMIRESG